jgi:hypothetical protein
VDLLVGGVVLFCLVVDAVVLSDLSDSSVDGMGDLGPWVGRSDEGGFSSEEVLRVGHDGSEVAVDAAAEFSVDGTGVGVQLLFELLDGSGGRFAMDFDEFHMGERKSLDCTHRCCVGCCWPWRGSRGYNKSKNIRGAVFFRV